MKKQREFSVGFTANVDTAKLKRRKMDGKTYLVGPVVMAREGVMNRLLYTASELKKSVPRWNGRPVTVGHPKSESGTYVSANAPDILEATQLGFLFHCSYDGENNKLKGECWLDEKKLPKFPTINSAINKGEMLEVSTGLFLDRDGDSGKFGEDEDEYDATAINHGPDHFALLGDEKGACSIEDGAGFPRANQQLEILEGVNGKKGGFLVVEDDGVSHLPTSVDGKIDHRLMGAAWAALHGGYRGHKYEGPNKETAIAKLRKMYKDEGMECPAENAAETSECLFPDANAVTTSNMSAMLSKALQAKFNGDASRPWIEDFTPNTVYFSKFNASTSGYDLFRLSFTVDDKETKVSFVGDPVAVVRKVTYEDAPDANESKKGTPPMTRKDQVDALIKANSFAEAQRTWLEGLPEDQFAAINTAIEKKVETPKTETPSTPKSNAEAPKVETPKTEVAKTEVNEANDLVAEAKGECVDKLMKVNKDAFTREELMTMPLKTLRKMVTLSANAEQAPTADRTGLGGPGGAANAKASEESPLVAPSMFEQKKD